MPGAVDAADEWQDLFQKECALSQQESDSMKEACALQSDTESESDSESSSTCPKLTLWWAQMLHKCLKDRLGVSWPSLDAEKHPLTVVSCCMGSGAEAAAMKARRGERLELRLD